nr:vegetative cell wall protein gp1-like [Equus asinus]
MDQKQTWGTQPPAPAPPLSAVPGSPLPPLGRGPARRRRGGGARTCPRRPRPDNAPESSAHARPVPSRSRQHSPVPRSPAEAQAPLGAARGHGQMQKLRLAKIGTYLRRTANWP